MDAASKLYAIYIFNTIRRILHGPTREKTEQGTLLIEAARNIEDPISSAKKIMASTLSTETKQSAIETLYLVYFTVYSIDVPGAEDEETGTPELADPIPNEEEEEFSQLLVAALKYIDDPERAINHILED